MSDRNEIEKLAEEAFHIGEATITSLAAIATQKGGKHGATYASAVFCIGAMRTVAALLTKQERTEKHEDFKPKISSEAFLVACLLLARMSPQQSIEGAETAFDQTIVLDALRDYETLTGKKPDEYLEEGFVKPCRAVDGVAKDALMAFLDAERKNPNLPSTLN